MTTVLVYSDDAAVREQVRVALGRRPAPDLSPITYLETAAGPETMAAIDQGGIDLVVLDGEAWPTGGMGLSRQIKDEIRVPPEIVLLVARRDDRWLAKWSLADGVIALPIDPVALADVTIRLLRERGSRTPVIFPAPSGRAAH